MTIFTYHLKISFRNLRKYKTQNIISIRSSLIALADWLKINYPEIEGADMKDIYIGASSDALNNTENTEYLVINQ